MQENKEEKSKEQTEASLREQGILNFWKENKIFEKSLDKDAPMGEFTFYDGPPFATGLPHFGHLLPNTLKDVIPRYKTMKGFKVLRRWGWDCHGLPIENLVEKELGLNTKKDVLDYGIGKFNEAAQNSVLRYESDWKKIIPRVGRWVDMDNDYKTMDWKYTESIWWVFKTLFDKGLIYEGYKSMHICPRCETTLANFEVSQGYKDVVDISVYVRFEIISEDQKWKDTSILAWTTTPWTLPGNVALAANPEMEYVIVADPDKNDNWLIVGKPHFNFLVSSGIFPQGFSVKKTLKGVDLLGLRYRPLFDFYSADESLVNRDNGWKVYGAGFVTETDGTGIVHIAPAFGEDDMTLGKEKSLPFIQHVGMDGRFKNEVLDFAGMSVKPKDDPTKTDIEVLKNLAHRGLLFAKKKVSHPYPHCWRCDSPLLNYAASSWFVKVTDFKDKLVANNKKTSWVPENIRDGRFGKWLEGARDWAISRTRFWGAPLPVWKCEKCKKVSVFGSIKELLQNRSAGNRYFLMRHGEGEHNVSGIFSSLATDKVSLTNKGREEVLASVEKLKMIGVDLIVSSDFVRTRETSELVHSTLGLTRDIVFDERLREIDAGDFNGKPLVEYQSFFSSLEERFEKRPPGAKENLKDLKRRITAVLYDLDSKYKGKNILIVGHGDPLLMLEAGSRGADVKETIKMKREEYSGDHLGVAEFKEISFTPLPHNEDFELDLHKPHIDEVFIDCQCGGKVIRVPDVFDCWFESGSMPYGQIHYPFENKEWFEKNFPADFIAEGLDQTRGWFYSLMVLSTALFDKPAFKNVIVNGLILAEDGQKMSKRLKNYPDLMYVMNKYGADPLRYFLISLPVVRAEDANFSEKGVDEIYKKIVLRLYNVLSFFDLYTDNVEVSSFDRSLISNSLDKWMIARMDELTQEVERGLESYEIDRASRPIASFIDDLSTWYIRRSRERLKGDNLLDKESATRTTKFVLRELCKIMAPFMPFTADDIYQKLRESNDAESVHLEAWPEQKKYDNHEEIISDMEKVRKIVSLGLEKRLSADIKVRQPLSLVVIKDGSLLGKDDLIGLIKDELNIKEVRFDPNQEAEIILDTNITKELKEEGLFRELVRHIQDLRKKEGLVPDDKIAMKISGGESEGQLIHKFIDQLKKLVGASDIVFSDTSVEGRGLKIGDMTFLVTIEK